MNTWGLLWLGSSHSWVLVGPKIRQFELDPAFLRDSSYLLLGATALLLLAFNENPALLKPLLCDSFAGGIGYRTRILQTKWSCYKNSALTRIVNPIATNAKPIKASTILPATRGR